MRLETYICDECQMAMKPDNKSLLGFLGEYPPPSYVSFYQWSEEAARNSAALHFCSVFDAFKYLEKWWLQKLNVPETLEAGAEHRRRFGKGEGR